MTRVEQFVSAMMTGRAGPSDQYDVKREDEFLARVVRRAVRLDQLIAEHELAEITPPNFCSECGGPWDKHTEGFEHVVCCSKRDRT